MLHGKFKSQYTLSLSSSFLLLLCPSLEKGETPRYHGSKISESRQPFLIQPDGHFHFPTTDKKPMGCRSVPDHECNHAPKIHTHIYIFFLPSLHEKMDLQQLQNQCKYEVNTTFDQICLYQGVKHFRGPKI